MKAGQEADAVFPFGCRSSVFYPLSSAPPRVHRRSESVPRLSRVGGPVGFPGASQNFMIFHGRGETAAAVYFFSDLVLVQFDSHPVVEMGIMKRILLHTKLPEGLKVPIARPIVDVAGHVETAVRTLALGKKPDRRRAANKHVEVGA